MHGHCFIAFYLLSGPGGLSSSPTGIPDDRPFSIFLTQARFSCGVADPHCVFIGPSRAFFPVKFTTITLRTRELNSTYCCRFPQAALVLYTSFCRDTFLACSVKFVLAALAVDVKHCLTVGTLQ